jgi:hypothetical protein
MVTHQLTLSPAIANFIHYKLRTIEPPAYESPRIVEFIRDKIATPLKACVSHATGAVGRYDCLASPDCANVHRKANPADNLRL